MDIKIDVYSDTNGSSAATFNADVIGLNATNDYWQTNIAVSAAYQGMHASSIRIYSASNSGAFANYPTNSWYLIVNANQIKAGY